MKESGFPEDTALDAIRREIRPLVEKVKSVTGDCQSRINRDNSKGLELAKELIDRARPLLDGFGILLPAGDQNRMDAIDGVADMAMNGIFAQANEVKESLTSCLPLLEQVLSWAAGETTKQRARDNLNVFKENLAFREKEKVFTTCWFCKKGTPDSGGEAKVDLYGQVWRDGRVLRWKTISAPVPRCTGCRTAHRRTENRSGVGGLVGFVLGLGGAIAFFVVAERSPECGTVVASFFGVAMTTGIGASIGRSSSPATTRPVTDAQQFPAIQEKLKEGWKVGTRPPDAS
jgi:hypothetical protein